MGHAFWLSYLDEWPLSLVICRLYKEINLLPSSSSIRAWFCWFLAQTLHMRLIIFLGSDLAYEAHYNLSPQQKKLHFRSFQWKDQIIARSRGIGGKGNFHLPALPFFSSRSAMIDAFTNWRRPSHLLPRLRQWYTADCELAEDLGLKFFRLQVLQNLPWQGSIWTKLGKKKSNQFDSTVEW